jgi:2-dehydropantoate 2-reductase
MTTVDWPRIAVMGAGAVGCYFGGMLARAGAPVTAIARGQRAEAIASAGLRLECVDFDETVQMSVSPDVSAVHEAQIVLLAVKTPDTETAAAALAPHLRSDAVIVSLQNGVDNPQRIRRHVRQRVVAAVVYVAAEMRAPGHVKHNGQGHLIIGGLRETDATEQRRIENIAAMFVRAAVPCRVSAHVDLDLWAKLTMNCAYNGMSALTRTKYGPLAGAPLGQAVLEPLVHEVVAVARARGIPLVAAEMIAAAYRLASAIPEATSSTAQDIERGRRTEIDELNGHVARLGDELGVPAPVNRTVHALVKLLEERAMSSETKPPPDRHMALS